MPQNVVSKKVYTKMLLVKKVYTKTWFSNNDIVLDFIDSDIFSCFSDNMSIFNNISLGNNNFDEDDPETIIHVRLTAWRNRFKQRKTFKKWLTNKLMLVAWHSKRW